MGPSFYCLIHFYKRELLVVRHVGFEDLQGEAHPGQEGQAEQAHPPVDQDEDWKHNPVQREEEALEENQAEAVISWSGPSSNRGRVSLQLLVMIVTDSSMSINKLSL